MTRLRVGLAVVAVLVLTGGGYLWLRQSSLVAVKDVQRFEAELLRYMRAEHQDILDDIRDKKEISKETGDKLKAAVAA